MYDLKSFGKTASLFVLHESRSAELLEEVDEDDLILNTGLSSEPRNVGSSIVTLSVAVLLGACCVTVQHLALLSCVLSLALGGCFIVVIAKRRLKSFIQRTNEVERMARKANKALLQREMLAFGLGLSLSQALDSCRLRVFLYCRENILFLSSMAEHLASPDFMSEERCRLVVSFYTEEMKDLVHSSTNLESSHVTQREIGALLDLFVLHRSEVLRLMVLYFFRAPFTSSVALLLRICFPLHRAVDNYIERFSVLIDSLSRRRSVQTKLYRSSEMGTLDGLDAVVLSLEDIISGITRDELNVDQVKRALQRVLSMKAFVNSTTKLDVRATAEDVELIDTHTMKHKQPVVSEFTPRAPISDEVFEVIASHEDVKEGDFCDSDMGDVRQQSRELMDELRMALAGRASEFAARERRALAAFYGVSEIELDEVEKSQRNQGSSLDAVHSEGLATDTFYESSDQNEEFNDNRGISEGYYEGTHARTLPPDLIAALRMRSVAEETIGDDDD